MFMKKFATVLCFLSTFFCFVHSSSSEEMRSERCYRIIIQKDGHIYSTRSIKEVDGAVLYDDTAAFPNRDHGIVFSSERKPIAYFPVSSLDIMSCSTTLMNGRLGGSCTTLDSGELKALVPKVQGGVVVELRRGNETVFSEKLP